VYVLIPLPLCARLRATAFRTRLYDLDLLQELQIGVRYGPNTMAIRRQIHEMIRRLVPVHAMNTRRRFGSKTASFHVSVSSCIIYLFIVVCIVYMLFISFHVTVGYIFTSMITWNFM